MMTKEERELVYKELCARLPYRTSVSVYSHQFNDGSLELLTPELLKVFATDEFLEIKLYLRPMSSMTDEEIKELQKEHLKDEKLFIECINKSKAGDNSMRGKVITHFAADYCDRNHFDYRGLIPMGLALEAPEDMYKTEKK